MSSEEATENEVHNIEETTAEQLQERYPILFNPAPCEGMTEEETQPGRILEALDMALRYGLIVREPCPFDGVAMFSLARAVHLVDTELSAGTVLYVDQGQLLEAFDQQNQRMNLNAAKICQIVYSDVDFSALEEAEREGRTDTITLEDGTKLEVFSGSKIKMALTLAPIEQPEESARREPWSIYEVMLFAVVNYLEEIRRFDLMALLLNSAYTGAIEVVKDETGGKPKLAQQDIAPVSTHLQGISKLSNTITALKLGEDYSLDVSGPNETKRSVKTAVRLDYEEQDGIRISRPMTAYDRCVHDSVATLWAAGNKVLTPRQVYHAMTGAKNKPSSKALAEVEASIDKQFRTWITLDYSEEARGRELAFEGEPVKEYKVETHMLAGSKETIRTAKGSEVVGYRLIEAPILYRHDMATRQIISYPQTLLEASSNVASNTPRNILIRDYLIKRIKRMRGKAPREIRYATLYEEIGEADANRKARQVIRDSAAKYLDSFKESGLITGWTEYTDKKDAGRRGTAKTGVIITTKEE